MEEKQTFTREEVVLLIDEMLQYPELITDAINNEQTDWHGETLLVLAEDSIER